MSTGRTGLCSLHSLVRNGTPHRFHCTSLRTTAQVFHCISFSSAPNFNLDKFYCTAWIFLVSLYVNSSHVLFPRIYMYFTIYQFCPLWLAIDPIFQFPEISVSVFPLFNVITAMFVSLADAPYLPGSYLAWIHAIY